MLLTLLPEVKLLIACNDSKTWFRMWWCDPIFKKWAETEQAIKQFSELFSTVETTDRYQIWKLFNKTHRFDDLPAIIYANGTRNWYYNGKIHRDGDLPAVIYANGCQEYYKGKRPGVKMYSLD